jgi:hypothetical protein
MENETKKLLVNPVALRNCLVRIGEQQTEVLDISFVRLVVADIPDLALEEGKELELALHLDRYRFPVLGVLQTRGDGWMRFSFTKVLPSAGAHLRSFLSPKRIGESIIEDWRTELVRHYHGLNESELWFDQNGEILFSYLDTSDHTAQFMIRLSDNRGPLRVGKLLRQDYIELKSLESDPPLIPLSDREIYAKLGECRDVVTNFRPNGQMEYNLKQRLLKVISEHLYSTSRKVEMAQPRASAARAANLSAET